MGGIGSGNWGGSYKRERVEDKLCLDVYQLIDNKFILNGLYSNGILSWGDNNRLKYHFYNCDKRLQLEYNCEGRRYEYSIYLTEIRTNYRGKRWAFKCPECSKRYIKLYLENGLFKCRKCHNLVHQSTQIGKMEKILSYGNRLV